MKKYFTLQLKDKFLSKLPDKNSKEEWCDDFDKAMMFDEYDIGISRLDDFVDTCGGVFVKIANEMIPPEYKTYQISFEYAYWNDGHCTETANFKTEGLNSVETILKYLVDINLVGETTQEVENRVGYEVANVGLRIDTIHWETLEVCEVIRLDEEEWKQKIKTYKEMSKEVQEKIKARKEKERIEQEKVKLEHLRYKEYNDYLRLKEKFEDKKDQE